MLSTTKVYVDSRYAITDTGSSIEYQIPGGVELKPTTRCWLSEFTCVASWHTIDNSNSNLFILEGAVRRGLEMPHGVYDLESFRSVMQEVLNGEGRTVGTYSVELLSAGSGGGTVRALNVSCSSGAFAISDDDTVRALIGPPIDSISSLVSFPTGYEQRSSHESGLIDLRRVHSLYVHSPSFGAYNSVGPRGERTILAKIPCSVGYGQLVVFQGAASEHDYIEAGVSGLTTLRLELRDAGGRLLNLHGTHWSATLLFER